MKIVLAPDSFKESMTAKEVCIALEKGLKKGNPNIDCIFVPMADGGEGTTQSLVDATNGKFYEVYVTNPLGEKIKSSFGILGDSNTAILEMASASGLELIPREKRNPLITTTYGTGELIKGALDKGVSTILIGIGGSATNDGGAGMIQALGGKLLDNNGKEIGFGGGELSKIEKIDLSGIDKRLKNVKIIVACDVQNPLTGPNGASHIFGKQKGANENERILLDNNLKHFSQIIKRDLGKDIENISGAGAAGGLGGGLIAFLNSKLRKGIDIVIEYSKLEEKLKDADLVITGEGCIDGQTRFGKTPYGVAKLSQKYNIPVIGIAGSVGKDIDILYKCGFTSIFSILPRVETLDEAIKNGKANMEYIGENIGRLISIYKK
ncbi:glycerate kinase [Fusobacterium perfoetens]|uniref:glycerate kinase family protein n=1 Tax=Fusobacterium perfoetens TaxID=852 RepID=UPI000488B784|nr:glycerate kinase [Fusobacterium perfoetens]MCI6151683.1 glycerate kinase [Fusobacterium perfoetens]MDY3236561.1 glycerate kinase [Fusobacterium perfoetens]